MPGNTPNFDETKREFARHPGTGEPPRIPDHELLRRIGSGSYGEVWLARSVIGTFHAIKIVYRQTFDNDVPYEREFRGIKMFEPVSRSHHGLVNVLHVGRNDSAGYYYYVMELADNVGTEEWGASSPGAATDGPVSEGGKGSTPLDPLNYFPETLGTTLHRQGPLPPEQCVELGLDLASALRHLHRHGLIHRDIKPSNIIFVHGRPKIADIGLVADMGSSKSFVGTEGFIPREGPGTAQADIYSLGKVLYEISTGLDRVNFPILPDSWIDSPEQAQRLELNEIVLRACEDNVSKRYADADQMLTDLEFLNAGKSIKRLRALERRLALLTKLVLAIALMFFLGAGAYYQVSRAQRTTAERLAESYVAYGTRSVNEKDLFGSLPWYAEALRLEQGNPAREERFRVHMAMVLRLCPRPVRMWFQDMEAVQAEFSPDGRRVVAVGGDSLVHGYEVESDQRVLRLAGHAENIMGACFSEDGQYLASAGSDDKTRIWRWEDGQLVQALTNSCDIYGIDFHPGGRWVAVALEDQEAQLWDWREGILVRTFSNRHSEAVRSVHFSADGRFLVTAGQDALVQVWDVATGEPVGEPMHHDKGDWIYDAKFSPDARHVVSAAFGNKAILWEVGTGRMEWVWEHPAAVHGVAYSPDGRYVATACWDLAVRVWDVTTHKLVGPPIKHSSQVNSVAFSPEGRRLVTTAVQGIVTVWDLAPIDWRPESIASQYTPDGSRYVTLQNSQIQLRDAVTRQAAGPPIETLGIIKNIGLNRDGSRVLVYNEVGNDPSAPVWRAQLWDGLTGKSLAPAFTCEVPTSTIAMSEDGRRVAVSSETDGEVWDTIQGVVLDRIRKPSEIQALAMDPNGNWAAFARDSEVEILEIGMDSKSPIILELDCPAADLEFSADGSRLLTALRDGTLAEREVQTWEVRSGNEVGPEFKHRDGVYMARYSPDGARVVTASEDNSAQLWSAADGRRLIPPLLHQFQVYSAMFSLDGERIATASRDNSSRVWDASSGAPVTPPLVHARPVKKARFVAHGKALLTEDDRRRQWLWDLTPDERPVADLERLARLLSGQMIDQIGGAFPLSREEVKTGWSLLRGTYPANFSVTAEEKELWFEVETSKAAAALQWSAVVFQLDQLLQTRPNDSTLLQRRREALEMMPSTP